jgi:hypothetical protein
VKSEVNGDSAPSYVGLFDVCSLFMVCVAGYQLLFQSSDVNAFLTLAATRHTLQPDDLKENPRLDQIVTAARAGRVPVHLVSSEFCLKHLL